MKRLIYILLTTAITSVSCDKNDVQEQSTIPRTVLMKLTFGAQFEQSVEPFDSRAASANINSLLVLIFDQNNTLNEILWTPSGNSITKFINGVPNQIYTLVYISNCRYDMGNNAQLKIGATKITDIYNISNASSGIPGGDLIGYGSQKRILTTDTGTVTATLTPKMARVVMKLSAAEKPANKQYLLYYKSQMMQTMTLDGKSVTYTPAASNSNLTETFTLTNGQYIAYMRPSNPVQGNGNMTVRVSAKSLSGTILEDRVINVIPSVIPQEGKSYRINIATKFPDAGATSKGGVIPTQVDTLTLEP